MTLNVVINSVVPHNLLFPHQRVICPHSRLSEKYRIVTHNFTNDNLTDWNSPSYQWYPTNPPEFLSPMNGRFQRIGITQDVADIPFGNSTVRKSLL